MKLKVLKVIDTRQSPPRLILFRDGSISPTDYGFVYSFEYSCSDGTTICGCGLVENERYRDMTAPEIELTCQLENPVTEEDRKELIDELEITDEID